MTINKDDRRSFMKFVECMHRHTCVNNPIYHIRPCISISQLSSSLSIISFLELSQQDEIKLGLNWSTNNFATLILTVCKRSYLFTYNVNGSLKKKNPSWIDTIDNEISGLHSNFYKVCASKQGLPLIEYPPTQSPTPHTPLNVSTSHR